MPVPPAVSDQAIALLRELGAAEIAHPGGTLLAHLQRVQEQLAAWGARPALQLAGLCHAFYGTDGYPTALLPLERRAELAAAIGAEAEAIVYFYASCDRKATYPRLADADAPFRDRFTGRARVPEPQPRRDFAELSAANELDLARIDPSFREKWGAELLALFTRFRPLLSQRAWSSCHAVLGGSGSPVRSHWSSTTNTPQGNAAARDMTGSRGPAARPRTAPRPHPPTAADVHPGRLASRPRSRLLVTAFVPSSAPSPMYATLQTGRDRPA